jgi:hypothetical protein
MDRRPHRRRKAKRKVWHKDPSLRATCPKCGKVGSGIYSKWVLNEQKRRYEPYYWFAHPWSEKGKRGVHWHYIRKKRALEILGSAKLREKFGLGEVKEKK